MVVDTSEEEEEINLPAVLEEISQIEQKEKEIDEKLAEYLKELGCSYGEEERRL